jgi:hypothetical protein
MLTRHFFSAEKGILDFVHDIIIVNILTKLDEVPLHFITLIKAARLQIHANFNENLENIVK